MREIKFRAWDKSQKKMLSENEMMVSTFGGGASTATSLNKTLEILGIVHELMQYTGLKDKNGKEIYEGDILKWTHPDFIELKKEYKILEVKDIRNSLMIERDCQSGWIEIIGNIYENPDLIN